ncbi:MAG: hypothetical protein NTX44_09790 [Ignavibacteriales bacterium]|nr:hypothetical protein [Ignavibacteriales bacterium]
MRSQAELGIENKEINFVPKLRLGTDGIEDRLGSTSGSGASAIAIPSRASDRE